jgi:hypothetical protein
MKLIKFEIMTVLLLFMLPLNNSSGQKKINTSFEYSDHQINIVYEFQGDSTGQYDVSVALKRTSDSNFNLKPEQLTGDLGEGNFADGKRKIIWHLTQQEEESLTGDDYFFEVTASEIKKSGGIAWYVYVGGILLGGGAAAVLVTNKKSLTSGSNSGTALASPPGRPGN